MSLTQVGTHALLTGDTDATIPPRSSGDCCQRPMAASHKARLTPCCPAAGSSPSIATTSETSSESGVSITCSLARSIASFVVVVVETVLQPKKQLVGLLKPSTIPRLSFSHLRLRLTRCCDWCHLCCGC